MTLLLWIGLGIAVVAGALTALAKQYKIGPFMEDFTELEYLPKPDKSTDTSTDGGQIYTPGQPITPPIAPVSVSAPEKVYNVAKSLLGQHLTENTNIPVEEGCCQAVSVILTKANYPIPSGGISGVLALRKWMDSNNFPRSKTPQPGCIISSRNLNGSVAHIGVYLKYGIGSNNSFGGIKGLFTENYTDKGWIDYFVKQNNCDLIYHLPI